MIRLDIQAMRALAVALVLIYHIWPRWVPGGYVGVDVFFVISGFLITGLLIRDVEQHGCIRFKRFYVRRAARLLPASLTTLLGVIAGVIVLFPQTLWPDIAREIAAAAVYIENWFLHFQSLDYLAGDSAASPVQHFWSLGVEEQFYVLWPLAILLGTMVARRLWPTNPISGIRLVLGLVVLASLAHSIWSALAGPQGPQYFSTLTRAWQLGVGGLLAAWRIQSLPLGPWAFPLGVLGVVLSAFWLDAESLFPGYAALLPTLSAALMIVGGQRYNQTDLRSWLGGRPVQFLGDISYSLYLWHWPLVVFSAVLWGETRGVPGGLLLIAGSIVAATLSKLWVEDRFRADHPKAVPVPNMLLTSGASTVCIMIACGIIVLRPTTTPNLQEQTHQFPGAGIFQGMKWDASKNIFTPELAAVKSDIAQAYSEKCIQNSKSSLVSKCVYGSGGKMRFALIGDSHAVHWLPAFEALANKYDVEVHGLTKTACAFSTTEVWHSRTKSKYTSCLDWSKNVLDELSKNQYDFAIIAQSSRYSISQDIGIKESIDILSRGFQNIWTQAREYTNLIIIHPTPWLTQSAPECAAESFFPFESCGIKATHGLRTNGYTKAILESNFKTIDLTPYVCPENFCSLVSGGIFVFRDSHHITKSYSESMTPILEKMLRQQGVSLSSRIK